LYTYPDFPAPLCRCRICRSDRSLDGPKTRYLDTFQPWTKTPLKKTPPIVYKRVAGLIFCFLWESIQNFLIHGIVVERKGCRQREYLQVWAFIEYGFLPGCIWFVPREVEIFKLNSNQLIAKKELYQDLPYPILHCI